MSRGPGPLTRIPSSWHPGTADELGTSFLWGLGIFVALLLVTIVLVITLVGIVLAIVATSRWGHLVVGAVVAAVVAAIPVVGGLANFVVNSIGVGAAVYGWRRGG